MKQWIRKHKVWSGIIIGIVALYALSGIVYALGWSPLGVGRIIGLCFALFALGGFLQWRDNAKKKKDKENEDKRKGSDDVGV